MVTITLYVVGVALLPQRWPWPVATVYCVLIAVPVLIASARMAAGARVTPSFVKVRKGYVGTRPRTWLSLTSAGRRAFEDHLAALSEIARGLTP